MTDGAGWTPPGEGRPDARQPAPGDGPPHEPPSSLPPRSSPPAYGAPPYGSPPGAPPSYGPSGPGSPGAWTPPPRPGLIPLRPLDVGTILGAPYRALRRNPRPTFGVALLLQAVSLILTTGVVGGTAFAAFSRLDFASGSAEEDRLFAGAVGITVLAAVVPLAFSVFVSGLLQGVVVLEIAGQSMGRTLRFPALWRRARGRLLAAGGYALLVATVFVVVVAALAGIVFALSLAGTTGVVVAVVLAVLLGLGLAVASAWISTKLAFVPSVIVLERRGIADAVRRSWRLTAGAFWKTFGIILLVATILSIATQVITVPLQLLPALLTQVLAPTGDESVAVAISAVAAVLVFILTLLLSALTVVVQSATTVLLYIDQRFRKEGLDLEIARFVEAGADGGVDDPFLRTPPAAPGPAGAPGSAP